MTELVAIAPIPLMDMLMHPEQPIWLALMHLMEDPFYGQFYQTASDHGHFVILDNSQHEGFHYDIQNLVRVAETIGASEIILPDAIEDGRGTVDKAREAFALMVLDRETHNTVEGLRPSFQLVPHGKTVTEWIKCLHDLVALYGKIKKSTPKLFTKPLTIGFPAQYAYNVFDQGDLLFVITELEFHAKKHGTNAHILGWDRSPWDHVPWLIERFPFRSVDTSKMFSFALYEDEPYANRTRGSGFFERDFTQTEILRARSYLREFKARILYADNVRMMSDGG